MKAAWKMVADCIPGGLSVSILVALKAAYGQSIASNSTLQSELIGASTTADKAAWFYHFMKSYPFLFGVKSAPSITTVHYKTLT